MLAVGLGIEAIQPYLESHEPAVKTAAVNSKQSTTLSGDTASIIKLQETFTAKNVFVRLLKTGAKAYHSHHMVGLDEEYERLVHQCVDEIAQDIATEPLTKCDTYWQSSVTPYKNVRLGPSYWRKNLESPVLFAQSLDALLQKDSLTLDLFVEVGPHPILRGFLNQMRTEIDREIPIPPCLPTLERKTDAVASMLTLSGNLFIKNTSINLAAVNGFDLIKNGALQIARGSLCIDLPNYVYHYGPIIYHENRYNKELRLRKHVRHDVLGARQAGNAKNSPSWRNMLRSRDLPWLKDHKVRQAFGQIHGR